MKNSYAYTSIIRGKNLQAVPSESDSGHSKSIIQALGEINTKEKLRIQLSNVYCAIALQVSSTNRVGIL